MEGLKNTNLLEAIIQLADSKDKGWKEKNYCYARFMVHYTTLYCTFQ